MKKGDIILLAIILAVALLLVLGFIILRSSTQRDTVIVEVDGKIVKKLPLGKNTEYRIDNPNGGFNMLIIKDGKAYISEASCPDKICAHSGSLSELKPIVCAPNKLVITLGET